ASDEDGIERIRSRKMKQLKKQNNFKGGGLQKSKKIKYCTADFLSEDIIDQVNTNKEIPVKVIQEQLQRKFQLVVSRMKAFRAKAKAVDNVRGNFTLQYTQLRDYVMELQQSNNNITVKIGVESEAGHMKPTRVFRRIYVCLGAAKEGFKACMRQFLGFYGTFIKGPFPGQLLTAVGVDPNNGIYPLAYGIVETESRESWTWFLQRLKEYLDLQENSNFTFISDRQKGIIPAIAELFPTAKHKFYLRHIHENIKLKKWEITGMPCKNAVASNRNITSNNMEVGLPESWMHPCYRLDTWKQVYNHHINHIRGKIMWPKSHIPAIVLPPNHHPQARKGHDLRPLPKLVRQLRSQNNADVGVQTRSKATNKGNQPTAVAKKHTSLDLLWLEKLLHLFLEMEDKHQDTVGFEFGQNQKNQYFGSLVDTGKLHEIPHSYHNKKNLVTHVDNNYHYSSDCNSVLAHRQARIVVDNHNHHVNYSHINCISNSRTEVVEGGRNC
nr:transposase, mutator type [Tanacetum cinerariifolium]